MLNKFNEIHQRNLSQINGITISIDEYLIIMKKVWDIRTISNRAEAIINWKNIFINSKANLVSSYDSILQNIYHLYSINSITKDTYRTNILDLERLLPLLPNVNINGISFGNQISNSSHQSLFEMMNKNISNVRGDFNDLIPKANKSHQDYIRCVSDLEKAKTANYAPMGFLEDILRLENNELGSILTNFVLTRQFENLSFSEFQNLLIYK